MAWSRLRDTMTGEHVRARARVVVNAAGPWVEEIWRRAGARAGDRGLQLTKGIHLVVDHARLPLRHAVVMQAHDKRSVFAVPRDGITYLGTTDTFVDAPALHPGVTVDDVDYLLDAARRTFAGHAAHARRRAGVVGGPAPASARGGQGAVGDLAQGRDRRPIRRPA